MTHVSLPPAAGPWVEKWLSAPRFGVYLTAAGGNRQQALDFYRWNATLSCAVLHDLGHFEVALRNAYAGALDSAWTRPVHWLDSPASPLRAPLYRTKKGPQGNRRVDVNEKIREDIDRARRRYGAQAPPGKIVADLSLGLWRYLSSTAHEKTLWVPYLHRAFPHGTSRARLDRAIGGLHQLRNRAAHWEPLLTAPVARRMGDLLWVTGLLSPDLSAFISHHSEVRALLAKRP